MNCTDFESELSKRVVDKNWDLPSCNRSHSEIIFSPKKQRYFGPDYATREEMKNHGWKLTQSSEQYEATIGYGLIVYSHFYRSQEASLNNRRKHPKFSEFMCHWLHSDKSFIPESIFATLAAVYPRPAKFCIETGKSYWRRTA